MDFPRPNARPPIIHLHHLSQSPQFPAMSTAPLRIAPFRSPPANLHLNSFKSSKLFSTITFTPTTHLHRPIRTSSSYSYSYSSIHRPSPRSLNYLNFASNEESIETETKSDEAESALESEILENPDGLVDETNGESESEGENSVTEEEATSGIFSILRSYKEAVWNNNESTITEIEGVLKSIEDEKVDLEKKVVALLEELSNEKVRILRISADFDNFRKRTERERLSLVTNAQGEVLEKLLPVLDNFERAKTQIKVESEGEEKIKNSYQSISKQFVETLNSLGVESVETVGKPFDPLLHEAIMREESIEYGEDIVVEEYRKGFKLADRLLRPSMVKVSAGPGPVVAEPERIPEIEEDDDDNETTVDSFTEAESTDEE